MPDKNSKPYPVYLDRLPPCNHACPSGQNIQLWLSLAKQSKFQEAWQTIMQDNPIPATMGRVCYHPCEDACNRHGFDASININGVERFLGDMALEEGWKIEVDAPKSSKKVMVVGAGPAGMSAAYHLCLLGHDVTVFDARNVGGGMMHYGIPSYRLPREILDSEVQRIADMGVEFVFNHRVEDVMAEKEKGGFAAVFVAAGAPLGRLVSMSKTGDSCQVLDAVEFLDAIEQNQIPNVKEHKVIVYGGGNTAIDAARCAIRLGASAVEIVYRRNREKMPAYDFEVAEATHEGITLCLLRTIKEINEKNISLDVMELNAEGWPEPVGKEEIIEADTLINALGLNVDTEFLTKVEGIEFKKDGCVLINEETLATGCPSVFAGGDMIPYDRSVTTAIGQGKKAACNIDALLRGEEYAAPEKHELAGQDKLHPAYFSKADRKQRGQIAFAHSKESFDEVVQSLDEEEVQHETNRCFSCGNCFECDTCMNVCPVKAITKVGKGQGYHIDYDVCIRCGLCVRKCPCGAMKMVQD